MLSCVCMLSLRGALVNIEGENHRTPLHEAAAAGHASIVELLINKGADPCPRDNHDATPYDLAYNERQEEVVHTSCEQSCAWSTALSTRTHTMSCIVENTYSNAVTHLAQKNRMENVYVYPQLYTSVISGSSLHTRCWRCCSG